MIICHEHKFVFVKTRKTGGSSIEIALSQFLSEGDRVTYLSPEEVGQCAPEVPFHSMVDETLEFAKNSPAHNPYRPGYPHTGMSAISAVFGEEIKGYHSFTVERNPWEKVGSAYFYFLTNLNALSKRRDPNAKPIEWSQQHMIETIKAGSLNKVIDFTLYARQHGLLVDEVIQYSDLDAELNRVLNKLGLPDVNMRAFSAKGGLWPDKKSVILPKLFGGKRGSEARAFITEKFAREIDLFGYKPEFDL